LDDQLDVDTGRLRNARMKRLFFLCSRFRTIISGCPTIPTRYVLRQPKTSPTRWRSRCGFRAAIVAKRLVEHLERSGFVVMKRPPIRGGAALGRGFEG